MDHGETRELIELASLNPHNLDHLLNDDLRNGGPLTAHLAACDACRAELRAVREASRLASHVVQTTPAPDLRARTLEYVAAVGRPRQDVPAEARRPGFRWPRLAWSAAVFATGAAVAALALALVLGPRSAALDSANTAIAEQQRAIAGLASVTDWSLRLAAAGDARTLRLTSPSSSGQGGTVVYSAADREMVMLASGLPRPTDDQEYRCWFESGGSRQPIGKMYFAGDLAYWAGAAPSLPPAGAPRFGVSLVSSASDAIGAGEVVLTGG